MKIVIQNTCSADDTLEVLTRDGKGQTSEAGRQEALPSVSRCGETVLLV